MPSHAFTLAQALQSGQPVYMAWCGLAAPILAELIARDGFPAIVLDQQHGLYDMASTAAAISAVHAAGSAPIVRIPVGDFAAASRVLDYGCEAVIAPMINTPADAQALVAAAKYPPLGERSWGPHRAAALAGLSDQKAYLRNANVLTLIFAMVETRAALKNLDVILKTRGIDGVFVGPSDLSIALSNGAVLEPESQDIERELDRVANAAKKARKYAGAYCHTAERAMALAERGFRLLAVGSDAGFLRAGALAQVNKLKGLA